MVIHAVAGADPGVSSIVRPTFTHNEAFVTADTRDHRGYPSTGGLYRTALMPYFDHSSDTFSFRQYEAEGASRVRRHMAAVPFMP